jgi:hypothetical protein
MEEERYSETQTGTLAWLAGVPVSFNLFDEELEAQVVKTLP